ncbi:MAG: NAD(P)-binding domain-containing protein [Pseudomonadota bacterium]
MARVGFIGTGHIAAPMARSAARDGHRVTVSERNKATSEALSALGLGIAVASNQGVLDAADIVVLSVRPAAWRAALDGLSWRSDHRIVSVMAGVPLSEIAAACAPATELCVTIPLGFLEVGGCPLPVYPDTGAVQAIWGAANPVTPVASEGALISHFAASALIPATLTVLAEGSAWLGSVTGDPDSAETYVSQLVAGYLADLPKDKAGQAIAARASLATPNTLSRSMVDALEHAGLRDALRGALADLDARMRGA